METGNSTGLIDIFALVTADLGILTATSRLGEGPSEAQINDYIFRRAAIAVDRYSSIRDTIICCENLESKRDGLLDALSSFPV